MNPMYRIVSTGEVGMVVTEGDDIAAIAQAAGWEKTGTKQQRGSIPIRACLLGQPTFRQVAGPMFDGTTADGRPVVRYEDWEAYERLSA